MRSTAFGTVMLVLAGAAFSSGPVAAATGCVELTAAINPSEVCAGTKATLTVSLTNCGQLTDQVALTATVDGVSLPLKATVKVAAGQTIAMARQVTIPAGISPGSNTLEITATTAAGGKATTDVVVSVARCN